MPCASCARSGRRSWACASRGSPTKRYALASAAGPMNSGSTSSERQADTHAPQWMHAIDCVMSIIEVGSTTYSRSGGSPSGRSHGTTRWIFFQWTASMSTIRSLITGMLPIGSTVIVPPGSCAISVLTLLWLPLRHRDVGVGDLRGPVAVDRQVDVAQPLVVVALGEVGSEL